MLNALYISDNNYTNVIGPINISSWTTQGKAAEDRPLQADYPTVRV